MYINSISYSGNDSYDLIGAVTSNREAQMEWKHYWVKVVARYNVVIEGWPDSIPFKNLSTASSPLAVLNTLLQSWQDGMTYWKRLTPAETDKPIHDLKAQGEIQEPWPCGIQSDRSKKQKQRPAALNSDDEDEFNPSPDEPNSNRSQKHWKAAIMAATLSNDDDNSGNSASGWYLSILK